LKIKILFSNKTAYNYLKTIIQTFVFNNKTYLSLGKVRERSKQML